MWVCVRVGRLRAEGVSARFVLERKESESGVASVCIWCSGKEEYHSVVGEFASCFSEAEGDMIWEDCACFCNYSCHLGLSAVQFWSSFWSYICWVILSRSYVHWYTRPRTFGPLTLLGRLFGCGASIQPRVGRPGMGVARSLLVGVHGGTVDAGSARHHPRGEGLDVKLHEGRRGPLVGSAHRVQRAAAVALPVPRTR